MLFLYLSSPNKTRSSATTSLTCRYMIQYIRLKQTKHTGNTIREYLSISDGVMPRSLLISCMTNVTYVCDYRFERENFFFCLCRTKWRICKLILCAIYLTIYVSNLNGHVHRWTEDLTDSEPILETESILKFSFVMHSAVSQVASG